MYLYREGVTYMGNKRLCGAAGILVAEMRVTGWVMVVVSSF